MMCVVFLTASRPLAHRKNVLCGVLTYERSILGMNLFGCKFCRQTGDGGPASCDRKNFDSLLWAIVTVFQVLYKKKEKTQKKTIKN